MIALDINGKVLQIGDNVCFTMYGGANMYLGRISCMTSLTITINENSMSETVIRKVNTEVRVVKQNYN